MSVKVNQITESKYKGTMQNQFQQAITQCEPKFFNSEASKQIWELSLNVDLSSILQTIKAEQDCSHVFYIYGEPGSGCTTLVQGVCQCLCESNVIKESDILYLSLNQGSSEVLLWDFMSKLANERNDQGKVTLFTQSSVKVNEKRKALCEFLQHHFKVICIDNAADHWVDALIKNVLKTCNITSFIVYNEVKDGPNNDMSDLISSISVYGLMESSAKALVTKLLLSHDPLTDEHKSNLCDLANCNPFALELLSSVLSSSDSTGSKVLVSTLQKSNFTGFYKKTVENCALDRVLEVILDNVLKVPGSIDLLCQLSSLRRPLPLLNIVPELEELLQLNLLRVKQEGDVKCVDLHPTLKKYISYKGNVNRDGEIASLDILYYWLSLVSDEELQNLIQGAEENAWPFVPEKWQFIKNVGEKDTSNVKERILSKNAYTSLTELQILQECLYHAYTQSNFQKLAAIIFVLDRFLFWQGGTKISMEIVDYIQQNSPETAIAPQLLVRRARFMKNEGNFRGADEVLDEVSKERYGVGQWKYKADYQFQLVKAACIQLKGEIQYSLGNWMNSASLLLESIGLFATLPSPDKKGIALGYGLLCPCLRNMTVQDYMSLALSFGLLQCHPLLAAYISAQEASKQPYTPMFFVRHICQAGEVMLELVRLATTTSVLEKEQLLRVAIEDLKDSIQAHQTYKSLTSREEFYIFVLASYQLSQALLHMTSNEGQETGHTLNAISVKLYEHYCSSSGHVLLNHDITGLINKCLTLLGLEKFQNDDLPNAGQALIEYYTRRNNERLEQNTRLAVKGLFANDQPAVSVSENVYGSRKSAFWRFLQQQHHSAEHIVGSRNGKTVDRYAVTVDKDEEEEIFPAEHQAGSRYGKTVDRYAVTVEKNEEEEIIPVEHQAGSRNGKTVDRYAVTVDKNEEEEIIPVEHQADSRNGKTVDRYAVTVGKDEEEEIFPAEHQAGSRNGKTVDRYAVTVGKDEEEEIFPAEHQAGSRYGKTVDRYAVTVGKDEEEEIFPAEHQAGSRNGKTVDRYAVTVGKDEEEEIFPAEHQAGSRNGKTVDRYAVTVGKDEEEEIFPAEHQAGSRNGKTVDRYAVTVGKDEEEEIFPAEHQAGSRNGKTVDRCVTKINEERATEKRSLKFRHEQERYRTVDECAFLISSTVENHSGVIVQSLEDDAVSLPLQTREIAVVGRGHFDHYYNKATASKGKRARDAILWKYDYPSRQWKYQPTMVYIGDPLQLEKGMEGAQRDVFTAEFINQDEPLGRYVAKQYRRIMHLQQYENDVLSQMTARQYVTWFNQSLSQAVAGAVIGEIQFLPVVLLQLVDSSGHVTEVFNAEPYMSGEFIKLTNNVDWKNEKRRTDLVLAFSHFTYQASNAKLIIVDIQGWAPHDNKGCTFLTDPQIHSTVYKCFGTGNFEGKGYENFWRMHSECNEICNMLKLVRPSNK